MNLLDEIIKTLQSKTDLIKDALISYSNDTPLYGNIKSHERYIKKLENELEEYKKWLNKFKEKKESLSKETKVFPLVEWQDKSEQFWIEFIKKYFKDLV